jgi:hypothetical protein
MALQDARCKVQEAACILYLVSVAALVYYLKTAIGRISYVNEQRRDQADFPRFFL